MMRRFFFSFAYVSIKQSEDNNMRQNAMLVDNTTRKCLSQIQSWTNVYLQWARIESIRNCECSLVKHSQWRQLFTIEFKFIANRSTDG